MDTSKLNFRRLPTPAILLIFEIAMHVTFSAGACFEKDLPRVIEYNGGEVSYNTMVVDEFNYLLLGGAIV